MHFTNKETDVIFVYENITDEIEPISVNTIPRLCWELSRSNEIAWWANFPHRILMSGGEVRYATVLKTVAHVCVGEDDCGNPVIEKWQIKKHSQW